MVGAAGGDAVTQAVKVVERDGAGGKGGAGDGDDGAPLPGVCRVADGEGGEGGSGRHDGKAREEAAGTVALPAQERADGKEDEAGECQRHDEAVVVGRADGDFAEVQGVGEQWVEGAGEDDEAGARQQPVVGEDAGFAGEQAVAGVARELWRAQDEEDERGQGVGNDEGKDVHASGRVGSEGVHGGEDAGADEEGADEAEGEGADGE